MDHPTTASHVSEAPILEAHFEATLARNGCARLVRGKTTTVQLNVGKVCNQSCRHCHVGAGPERSESMRSDVARRILNVLERSSGITTLDITGGAPELNPNLPFIVSEARRLGLHVIERCNLTVLLEPGLKAIPGFLAAHGVEIVASLPCYTPENVDRQRGDGVFAKSIRVLRMLNALGYGMPGTMLELKLAYNPLGPDLPPSQEKLEADYRQRLREGFGIEFNGLFTITNLPVGRFATALRTSREDEKYMGLLVRHFNPDVLENLMCRSLVSVGWDGALYDCDFNQMLRIPMPGHRFSVWNVTCFDELNSQPIATDRHCFGCTAGSGSGCGGSLA